MEHKIILKTKRLILREMTQNDYTDLSRMLQDISVMYAYEHAFSDEEVADWLDRQLNRYKVDGFGLWAMIEKDSGNFVGQAGLTMQQISTQQVPEIGYLLNKYYWHRGYATEAASAIREYAFNVIGYDKVYSIIRDNNYASQAVARRNGMHIVDIVIKHYYNIQMPHLIFCAENGNVL